MKTLDLAPARDSARPSRAGTPPPALLAQRHSTFGGGSVAAPPLAGMGRPLEPATRHEMERGFGRDFGAVRVHDDAPAHDSARSLGALAYAAGDNIVFAQGRYAPQTAAGRALIAHELAHSVQQGGVQMKADGPLPAASDARLEAEADSAALAITGGRPVPSLSRIGAPAIFRADEPPPVAPAPVVAPPAPAPAAPDPTLDPTGTPAPGAPVTATAPGTSPGLPSDVTIVEENPAGPGCTFLVVSLPALKLPVVKGKGDWVEKAYKSAAKGGSLIFEPVFTGSSVAARKEAAGEDYKTVWLNNYGFKTLKEMNAAFTLAAAADPEVKAVTDDAEVKKILLGFSWESLTSAKCDIDHIVEKQLKGASIASNMQLLVSGKNRTAGTETYKTLTALVDYIRKPNRTKVTTLQIRFADAQVVADTEDASFKIETLLRSGKIVGSADVKSRGEGTPLALLAGGKQEVIRVKGAGKTPVDMGARRIISGLKLTGYIRSASKAKPDTVECELASKPMLPIPGGKPIVLTAETAAAPTVADGAGGAAAAEGAAVTAAPVAGAAAGEFRALKIDKKLNPELVFYYPYLSPIKLTEFAFDEKGGFSGKGLLTPSLKFLAPIEVKFGPDSLEATTSVIPKEKLKTPAEKFFRFTDSKLGLQLTPKLIPSGSLSFQVGSTAKPLLNGVVTASVKDGVFLGTGTLTPAGTIPGIKEAKGEINYSSETGWSGKLSATSSSFPGVTEINAEIGFHEKKGVLTPYGSGGIKTTIKGDSVLFLEAGWDGVNVSYKGGVKIVKPLGEKLVPEVTLNGSYVNGVLTLTGVAPLKWKQVDTTITVTYQRKDGEEGKFSGAATVEFATAKMGGKVTLGYDQMGNYWGSGQLSYQVTKDIRPTLGVEFKGGRVRLFGDVAVGDIPLSGMWPAPKGAKKEILAASAKMSFPIPPLPVVQAFLQIKGSLGIGYGVGPLTLKAVKFNGELYPFEEDLKIKAHLTGRISMPAYAEVYGTFGAYIGAEVAAGAAGAKGGVEITPSLRLNAEGFIQVDVDYEEGGFKRAAGEAAVTGELQARLVVNLAAEVYALYGLLSHTWTYNVSDITKKIGPTLKLTLGTVAYEKDVGVKWPSLSDIKLEPADVNPLAMIKELLGSSKANAK
jgi:hypothetical protein